MGIMATQVQINDRDPVTLGLDTGADLMVISDRLARQLSLDLDNAREREILGFCGTQMGQQVTLDRVRIQQHELTNLEAVIIDAQILDLVGVDGLVGQNFLTRYRQHWRFGELNPLGFPDRGSLELEPIQ
jgi:predicted aspartyl protease